MIHLTEKLFLTKGSERICYLHPNDKNKIIKIIYNFKEKNNQNLLEYEYYSDLHKRGISFKHIAHCYGYVETNKGEGLVFEKIVDYNGKVSRSYREILVNKVLNKIEEKKLLKELNNYLYTNNILFADSTTINLLCKEYEPNKYRFVIIDGLGAKRQGVKFKLYQMFSFYNKYKIKKQWKIFLKNIEKVKKKIELNQQL